MELAAILVPIFLFVLIRSAVEQRGKERQARLELLEQALKNPAVDRATITSLAQQLTGARPAAAKPARGLAWLLALGWLTLFSGLGIWLLGAMIAGDEVEASGLLVSLIGFGLVTYPFALRELESRRPAA
jgi:hypothetical protein